VQLSFLSYCDDVAFPALKPDPDTEIARVVPADVEVRQRAVLFRKDRQEQNPQAAAQLDTPSTYRGYSYLVGENGVVLKPKDGGLRHFSTEEEAVAYVDSVTGGAR
jgi:hypothetical protein